jgi:hypothetical protein
MINKSFKDLIKKTQNTYPQINCEKQYTYEEFNKIQNETKEDIILQEKYSQTIHSFMDEQTTIICNYLNLIKDENNIKGFLNDMNYTDIMNIVMNNISVNEISVGDDENDQSFDEDDYY